MTNSSPSMSSVQQTFNVIEYLWELDGAGPSELAQEMGIPKSTAHLYLRSLQETNYVINQNGKYKLSYKFLLTGSKMKEDNEIFSSSKDKLQNLAEETGELAALVIEEGGKAIVLHIEYGEKAIDTGLFPGTATPLHSHAAGKSILAHLPEDRVSSIFNSHGLSAVTSHTITEYEQLYSELDHISTKGYAVDWNEQIKGMGVIGVPILIDDQLQGAIGIAGPTERIKNESYQEKLVKKAQETHEAISIQSRFGK